MKSAREIFTVVRIRVRARFIDLDYGNRTICVTVVGLAREGERFFAREKVVDFRCYFSVMRFECEVTTVHELHNCRRNIAFERLCAGR